MFRKHLIRLIVLIAASTFPFLQSWAELSSVAIRGPQIFTYPVLKASGGVILQAPASFVDAKGTPIAVTKLSLGRAGKKYCVFYEGKCYSIPAEPDVIAPLANWISRRQTVAFSMVIYTDDKDANEFVKKNLHAVKSAAVKEACAEDDKPCFVAKEFLGTTSEDLLHLLDFTDRYHSSPNEAAILTRLNGRKGVKKCDFSASTGGSYVNTDVDSTFVVRLVGGAASISGTLHRYYWFQCPGSSLPYFHSIDQLDDVEEPEDPEYSKATALAQVAALLRSFEERTAELTKLAVVVH